MVRAGWKRVTTIGLVALGLGVFALVAAFRPGADVPNQAWVDTSETSKVTADAKNAIQTLYTYKFDTVEQDFENARAVLDDAMREQFDKTAAVTKDAVIQTKTATNAEVTDIGLKLLSDRPRRARGQHERECDQRRGGAGERTGTAVGDHGEVRRPLGDHGHPGPLIGFDSPELRIAVDTGPPLPLPDGRGAPLSCDLAAS